MPQFLLRSAVLGYALLLWVSVWPFSKIPLLGTAQAHADKLLSAVSLKAGLEVFPGLGTGDFASHASCVEVFAHAEGVRRTLYAPECPRRGMQWRRDPLVAAISHMNRGRLQPLLRDPFPQPSEAAPVVRLVIELGDYFCHSEPDLERVVMRSVQYVRNMRDGSPPFPGETLVCTQHCSAGYTPPQCSLRRSEALIDSLR